MTRGNEDLKKLMDPKYIEVVGLFTPRGGISIHPFANYGIPDTCHFFSNSNTQLS